MGTTKLLELHNYMKKNSKILRAPPENLDQLKDSISLLEELQADLSSIESKIPPIHEQFFILEKYEIEVSEEVVHFTMVLMLNFRLVYISSILLNFL